MSLVLRPRGWWAFHNYSVDSYSHLSAGHQTTPTSTGTLVANRAYYIPVTLRQPVVLVSLWFAESTIAGGNVDIGLYDSAGNLIVSTGSQAKGSSGVAVKFDVTDQVLAPGLYYVALAASSATATYYADTWGSGMGSSRGVLVEDTAFPLPSTATWTNDGAMAYVPICGFYTSAIL